MSEPFLTEAAKADLEELWWFIAGRRDESTADRVASSILKSCRSHARFPESGRARDEIAPGLRSFSVSPYMVFYRPSEESILVLRILHGSRDTERIMRSEPLD